MKQILFYLTLLLILCASCDDVFVKDISGKKILVLCPDNNWEIELQNDSTITVNFWWNYLDGADNYSLQLVSPDFLNINTLIFDMVVDSNKYSIDLPAGQYQWRVRANNSSYSTNYTIKSFSIIDVPVKDISDKNISILSPNDNWAIRLQNESTTTVYFWWDYLDGADNYSLQLVNPYFSNINRLLFDVVVDSNKYNIDLPAGQYQWRIRANNSLFSTNYITRSFSVLDFFVKDISDKRISILSPNDNFKFQLLGNSTVTVYFWWDYLDGAEKYELQLVSPDFLNINTLLVDVVIDSNKYSIDLPEGEYQWRIRAKNSLYSTNYITRSFLVE